MRSLPTSITASNGSVVRFRFSGGPANHRVTQSSFGSPCEPLRGGFDSGWIVGQEGISSSFAEWNLTIMDDSEPIWFYCKQLAPIPQCKAEMVGSINAPTSGSNTFSAFHNAAKSSSRNPSQGEGALVDQGALASAPAGPFSDRARGISVPLRPSSPVTASATSSSITSTRDTSYWAANKPAVILAALFCATLANAAGYAVLGALIFWLA